MPVSSVSNITASSPTSWQDAMEKGLSRAAKTIRGIQAVEVLAERANIEKGEVKSYEVDLKIIFNLE